MSQIQQHSAIAIAMCALFFVVRKWVWLYALAVFPGTVAHELSHFFVGLVLGARPAAINLFPRRAENGLALGEVVFERLRWWNSIPVALAPFALVPLSAWMLRMSMGSHPVSAMSLVLKILAVQFLFASIPSGRDFKHALIGALAVAAILAACWIVWHAASMQH
jgi:tellurite resistance protein TehA-like permease